jgi:hypothetical protein
MLQDSQGLLDLLVSPDGGAVLAAERNDGSSYCIGNWKAALSKGKLLAASGPPPA